MSADLAFAPLLPWPAIVAFAALACVLIAITAVHGGRGWILRAAATAGVVIAAANPRVIEEAREPLPDQVVVVVDRSPSQTVGERPQQTDEALANITATLSRWGSVDVRIVEAGGDGTGEETPLFDGFRRAIADIPPASLAGAILITDGNVHDAPAEPKDWAIGAPVHVLLTGARSEPDRRLVIERAPAYGLVGSEARIRFRVEGAPSPGGEDVSVAIGIDGKEAARLPVPLGASREIALPLEHGGSTLIELHAEPLADELSTVNNRAFATINGVRERLRVLLVSGEPHAGERMWRNLLKSDPAVDLVHFTILRPPDKTDMAAISELSLIAFPVRELFEERLYEFDLVVFDRYTVRGILPWRYFERTAEYVERGGALLLAAGPEFAGPASVFETPLGRILPAAPTGRIIEQAFRPVITDLGRRHPITSDLPGERALGGSDEGDASGDPLWGRWFRTIEGTARSGSVIMTGPAGRHLLVVDRVGEGRVAQLMSDQLWLWARGYDGGGPDTDLVRRTVHWLMKEPALEEEAVAGRIEGNLLSIVRRTLTTEPVSATITDPAGNRQTLSLDPDANGIARATLPAETLGLYRIESGGLTAFAASGSLNAKEFARLAATEEPLKAAAAAAGGGLFWIADGMPELRRVQPGRDGAGRGWMGLRQNGASVVTGTRQSPFLPPFAVLALALLLLAGAWWREGR